MIEHQAVTFSENGMIVDAMRDFKSSFHNIKYGLLVNNSDLAKYKELFSGYYTGQFGRVFRGKPVDGINPNSFLPVSVE